MSRAQLILAHPLEDSFCAAIAAQAAQSLGAAGHQVDRLDLYRENFDPRLTAAERQAYYAPVPGQHAAADYVERLRTSRYLVLVFPQWWFNMPAILKGYFDRVFQPGVAFDHSPGYGQIRPRLDNLHGVLALTTLGAAWWVTELLMRNPVRRQIKDGIVRACAPQARFRMLNCYQTEKIPIAGRRSFLTRVDHAVRAL